MYGYGVASLAGVILNMDPPEYAPGVHISQGNIPLLNMNPVHSYPNCAAYYPNFVAYYVHCLSKLETL